MGNRVRLSRSVVVRVARDGVSLPPLRWSPLDPDTAASALLALELLSRGPVDPDEVVAEVHRRTATPIDAIAAFVEQLRSGGALVDGDVDDGPAEAAAPAAPAATLVDATAVTDGELVLVGPQLLWVRAGGFESYDGTGSLRLRLDAAELATAARFVTPTTAAAVAAHQGAGSGLALDRAAVDAALVRLVNAGLVAPFDPSDAAHAHRTRNENEMRAAIGRSMRVNAAYRTLGEAHEEAERAITERTGVERVQVLGVNRNWRVPPGALGLLIEHAKAYDGGSLAERFAFHPRLLFDADRLEDVVRKPSIALFSNYIWEHAGNLELSALAKRVNPNALTIHGGPDTPKYDQDVERYFADHPHVDITVRGEGEQTFVEILQALRDWDGRSPADLSVLADVAGLSYRSPGGVVRTADRDRLADIDVIPSPVLAGLFDPFTHAGKDSVLIVETNRGCPYGCTFCDWGSSTLSRIRKFDLDRVFAELEWAARTGIQWVLIADANFGIFERDVDIARHIAALKAKYGFPREMGLNYAKNTVKHLAEIIRILAGAGIVTEGKVSLQTMDDDTLLTIKRKNIKVEKYDDLSIEFRKQGLPLGVELMTGLPGSTSASLRADLQECIDRDVRAQVYATTLLPNSPMNEPSYRLEHGITARPGEILKETATYTRAEWEEMDRLSQFFLLVDPFGVLRQVALHVRRETGIQEMDFYERFLHDVTADRERWPISAFTTTAIPRLMVPPVSWKLFLDEVRAYVIEQLGVPDDSALETVFAVQLALIPTPGRSFPEVHELAHDYAAWFAAIREAKSTGGRKRWEALVPSLRDVGPGTFPITDPLRLCETMARTSSPGLNLQFGWWEFGSPVSRPLIADVPTDGPPELVESA